jgi:signal peptidase II
MAVSEYLYGRLTAFGVVVAALTAAADQALKIWLVRGFDLAAYVAAHGPVRLGPFIDLVLVWNPGISYGLFPQVGPLGQWALLAVKLIAVVLLWMWLSRAPSRLTALALGLIIGGAIGNAIDRAVYGAVADFVLFHITTATWTFNWYVFNLADAAIVAGVIGLLYESTLAGTLGKAPQKRPDP